MGVGMLQVEIRNLGESLIFLFHDFSQRELLDSNRLILNRDTMMVQLLRNLIAILLCRPRFLGQDFKSGLVGRHIGCDIEGQRPAKQIIRIQLEKLMSQPNELSLGTFHALLL